MYDVIVIGAGAAGLSAALWCDELGLKTLVLERASEIGGQLLWVFNPIENHLGTLRAANGRELRDLFAEQIKRRKFEIRTETEIIGVDLTRKTIRLSGDEELSARALVLATGVRRRRLNVAGEAEFEGRGVLQSGKLESDSVAGKTVCVVGGGDAAAENALILAEAAKKVYLVHRRRELAARREFAEKIKRNARIEIFTETEVRQISGGERVSAIELKSGDSTETFQIAADAVLIRIGVEPNTEFARGQIELDENGYIKIDNRGETGAENVFAVGDAANPFASTVSGAVGMGATAAKVISSKIKFD